MILVHSKTFKAFVYTISCISYSAQVKSSVASHNFLNETSNNNNVTHVANIVLNGVPNSSDAMRAANNVCLITMGTQQFSMADIYSHHAEKPWDER